MNIVKLLGITYKEDIVSNLIVGLINESESFRNSFLKYIGNIESLYEFNINAHTRVATTKGIPDIVITLENDMKSILLIIENKLKADEGLNQTLRYSDEKCINQLVNNKKLFSRNNNNMETKFIFLTLIPEQNPTGSEFINITYKDLIEGIKADIEDETLKKVYYDFIELMKEFYDGLEINKNDKLIETLRKEEDSEKVFIKFREIVKGINCVNGLNVREIGKAGGKGRVSFYAKISKDEWIGKDSAKLINNFYTMTQDCYDIHLEASFDIFNKNITLPLHYEPRPYIPRKSLEEKTKPQNLEAYINKRNHIKELIHDKIRDMNNENIKVYNGSNQIASIKIEIDENITIEAFRNLIEEYMRISTKIVDECLNEDIKQVQVK